MEREQLAWEKALRQRGEGLKKKEMARESFKVSNQAIVNRLGVIG